MRQPTEEDPGFSDCGGKPARQDPFTFVKKGKSGNMGGGKPFFPVEIGGLRNPFPTKKADNGSKRSK